MRPRKANDSFMIGFMIGVTIPVIGYWCIENLFAILTDNGIMDEVTSSVAGKRLQTLSLLAICTNIIPSQLASNKRYGQILKGVITATLIYAAFWILYFFLEIRF